jgi:hypothetical protein
LGQQQHQHHASANGGKTMEPPGQTHDHKLRSHDNKKLSIQAMATTLNPAG